MARQGRTVTLTDPLADRTLDVSIHPEGDTGYIWLKTEQGKHIGFALTASNLAELQRLFGGDRS